MKKIKFSLVAPLVADPPGASSIPQQNSAICDFLSYIAVFSILYIQLGLVCTKKGKIQSRFQFHRFDCLVVAAFIDLFKNIRNK